MSSNEETNLLQKITRSSEKRNIHIFLIFNKTGICLFARNITDEYKMEENLICSFFFAIMSFSKEIIGDEVKTIEMGGVKIVIIEKDKFYYGILCKAIENVIFLEDITNKIHKKFLDYVKEKKIDVNIEHILDERFHSLVDAIIKESLEYDYDIKKEDKIIEFLKHFQSTEEIEGIILLTDKGNVVHSSLNRVDLRVFLSEVDFRVKICNNSILKLFYTSKNNHLIFSEYVDDQYFIILVFDLKTKFGIAEYFLHKVTKFIRKALNT